MSVSRLTWVQLMVFLCFSIPAVLFDNPEISKCLNTLGLLSPTSLLHYRLYITKTCLYNFDPLKPHFYIVKLGFTGVYINFLISAQNIDCGYSLEPPRRGGSYDYPQSMF